MRIARRFPLLLFVALFACAAHAQEVGKPVPLFEVKDIFNKTVDLTQLRGWVIVLSFANPDNKDTAVDWLKQIRLAVPDRDNILFVAIADARKYKLMKLFAKGVIKQDYNREVAEFEKKIKERNLNIQGGIRDYFLLVTDWSAAVFKLFGIEGAADKPHMFLVDGDGVLRAHFTQGDSTESMATLTLTLFKELDDKKAAAAHLQFGRARRDWLKRLVLPVGALALYFTLK